MRLLVVWEFLFRYYALDSVKTEKDIEEINEMVRLNKHEKIEFMTLLFFFLQCLPYISWFIFQDAERTSELPFSEVYADENRPSTEELDMMKLKLLTKLEQLLNQ